MRKREAPQCICRAGSLTVESAVILPLFAAFFSFLLFFFQIMNVQLVIQGALEETARGLAVLSVKELEEPEEEMEYLLLAKALLSFKLKEEAETLQFVRGGASGVSLLRSDFKKDEIQLRADYVMCFPIKFFGSQDFFICQTACYRKWNGQGYEKGKDIPDELVYVAEYGEVYHREKSCSYISLTIRKTFLDKIDTERNKNGEVYEKCERCCRGNNMTVLYVTDYGDKYHNTITCSGLKRTIYQKLLSEVGGMPACGKCAK